MSKERSQHYIHITSETGKSKLSHIRMWTQVVKLKKKKSKGIIIIKAGIVVPSGCRGLAQEGPATWRDQETPAMFWVLDPGGVYVAFTM